MKVGPPEKPSDCAKIANSRSFSGILEELSQLPA